MKTRNNSAEGPSEESSIVTINVSGHRFQTYLSTLEKFPETLLGNKKKRKMYWNEGNKEYFFDRNPEWFRSILYYYQSDGQLHRPDDIPLDLFLKEISFFELGDQARSQLEELKILKRKPKPLPNSRWRRKIWCLLEYPSSSWLARGIDILTIGLTFLFCVEIAVQTMPQYRNQAINTCREEAGLSPNATIVPRCAAIFSSPFFIIQTICVAYFTLEFFLRLISTPTLWYFVTSPINYICLASIVPYYVLLIILLSISYINTDKKDTIVRNVLNILLLLRALRIFSVFKYFKSLRALTRTLRKSLAEFAVAIFGTVVLAFLFGSAAYCAENATNGEKFDSILSATYWGIITLTTVG